VIGVYASDINKLSEAKIILRRRFFLEFEFPSRESMQTSLARRRPNAKIHV